MAVYKSRRKDAAAQFVADARELRKATVRIARKFPASYKYVTTGPLLQLVAPLRECEQHEQLLQCEHGRVCEQQQRLQFEWLRAGI